MDSLSDTDICPLYIPCSNLSVCKRFHVYGSGFLRWSLLLLWESFVPFFFWLSVFLGFSYFSHRPF